MGGGIVPGFSFSVIACLMLAEAAGADNRPFSMVYCDESKNKIMKQNTKLGMWLF